MSKSDESKWEKVVARMLELTKGGRLEWEVAGKLQPKDEVLGQAYVTRYNKWQVVVYEYRYRYVVEPHASLTITLARRMASESEVLQDVAIIFIDYDGRESWRLPTVPGRWNLLQAVRDKLSGADDFAARILKEE